jgi:DNA repair exonuclease SbcCD nuclease subunit
MDYTFLGDIHKSNQKMTSLGNIRYIGSLVQQNFGELDDKGFLLWDIKNKDDFTQNLETASVLDSIYRFSTLKPLEMGENTAYYGLKYIAKSCVGMLILPFQLIYEYL